VALTFYFDTHIAKACATQLRSQAIEVVRCEEVGMAEASDDDHLRYATENGHVMVSQDNDFLVLDAKWRAQNKVHGGIFYIPNKLQGTAQIGFIVTQLTFYHAAEAAQAIDYATEIANQVTFLQE